MKKRIVLLLALLAMLVMCLVAFSSCGGDCSHPADSLTYHQFGTMMHNAFCNACNRHLEPEPCDTPDGKCGTCTKCGYTSEHEYVSDGNPTDEAHTLECQNCHDTKTEAHPFQKSPNTYQHVTYHSLTLHCYDCGHEVKKLGDHVSASGAWQTNGTSHWQICDDCGGEMKYGLHDPENGACTVCGYAIEALPVSENLEFTLSEDESYYALTKILVNSDDKAVIVVPATYNGKPVKVIGREDNAYDKSLVSGMRSVKALYIPDGVTAISSGIFGNYTNYAKGLVALRLPGTLTYIGSGAFYMADLYELIIPDTVDNGRLVIDNQAFDQCRELRTVVIGEGVTEIGTDAFGRCPMLTSVSLPSTLTQIDEFAFSGSDNIKTLTVQAGNSRYLATDNCLIERNTMALIRSNASMTVPAGVKRIVQAALSGDGYFYNTDETVEKYKVTIPASVEYIASGVFRTRKISEIACEGNALFATGTGCFYNKETDTLLWGNVSCVIPESVTAIGQDAFYDVDFDSFTIPAHIKTMHDTAFSCCSFNSLVIEEGTDVLCFTGCSLKQEVLTIPGSVKTVEYLGIDGYKKLVVSEGTERISQAISVEIVLPSTIKSAHKNIQYTTDGVNVSTYEGCLYFGDKANPYYILICPVGGSISGTLKLHPDTKVIADEAFVNCRGLVGITFNDKLAYIGKHAFANTGLAGETVLPDSVKGVGYRAFYQANGVDFKLILNNGIEELGEGVVDPGGTYMLDRLTKYGNHYYLGTVDNPYFAVVFVDDSWEYGKVYALHADTRMILTTLSTPVTFDGSVEQWGEIYKCSAFLEYVEFYWSDKTITCSNGVANILG